MGRVGLAIAMMFCPLFPAGAQNSDFLPVKTIRCFSGDTKVYDGTNVGVTANPAVMPGPGTTLVIKERDGTFTLIHGQTAICVMNWNPEALKPATPPR